MLEGKSKKLEFQEMSSSLHWKIKWARTKQKRWKRNPGKWKKKWMKRQWKMIFHEMIIGLITLKHSLGLLIFSFEIPNPGLHYVSKSPFWLNSNTWTEEVFPWEIFVINKAIVSFPQPKFLINHSPVWDEFLSA